LFEIGKSLESNDRSMKKNGKVIGKFYCYWNGNIKWRVKRAIEEVGANKYDLFE
jgi:hypothetical protein